MSAAPAGLTLGQLRRFVAEQGEGALRPGALPPDWEAPLGPAVNDSRQAVSGSLFVALPGERTDGHRFAAAAAAAGAAVLLLARVPDDPGVGSSLIWLVPDPLHALQRFAGWWRQQYPALVAIGVTGSVGKTTAKAVIAAALGTQMTVLASARSFNNEIGVPLTLLSLAAAHRAAVLEMGIYDVGDIAFLAGMVRQRIGLVLNVDAVHLERAGSIERIAQAKQEMIDTLPADGIAVLNHDDRRVRAMRAAAPGPVLTFGLQPGADWCAVEVRPAPAGLQMMLLRGEHAFPLRSVLPGGHHVYALLAAAAVLEAAGVPVDRIPAALEAVPAPAARQRFLPGLLDRVLIDDTYNASPLSMTAALNLLASQAAPRRVAILADMLELGPASEEMHFQVGEYAARCAGLVIAVGPQARAMAEGAGGAARWYADKESLRQDLDALLQAGDAVLVKGSRGMAMEEVVAWLAASS